MYEERRRRAPIAGRTYGELIAHCIERLDDATRAMALYSAARQDAVQLPVAAYDKMLMALCAGARTRELSELRLSKREML